MPTEWTVHFRPSRPSPPTAAPVAMPQACLTSKTSRPAEPLNPAAGPLARPVGHRNWCPAPRLPGTSSGRVDDPMLSEDRYELMDAVWTNSGRPVGNCPPPGDYMWMTYIVVTTRCRDRKHRMALTTSGPVARRVSRTSAEARLGTRHASTHPATRCDTDHRPVIATVGRTACQS